MWKILAVLFFSHVAFLFFAAPAFAALPVSINTTRIEITANPGDNAASSFTFWNGTDEFLPVSLEAADFLPSDEEGHVTVGGRIPEGNSLKEWIHPEYAQLAVAPQTEFEFRFSVDVPKNADPGTHYGVLLVSTAPVSQGAGAAIQTKIGPIILVKIGGAVKERLSLESFTTPTFLDSPPISLAARFRNEGTVHLAPVGDIEVRNLLGWLVATGTLPRRNVLPGAVRSIEASIGAEGIWFGRYTVSLRSTYGLNNTELDAQRTVWIVPWRTQGWKVLVGIGVLALVIWKRRNFGSAWYFLRTGLPPPNDM